VTELGARFRAHLLLVRKRSALTAEAYLRELDNLEVFLAGQGKNPFTATGEDLLSFLVWRHEKGLSRTTMARLVASVHSLYKFMKLEGLRHDDPSLLIRTPRQERTLPDVLQPEEVDKFLASIDLSTPNGLRDRALFELIYSCGLRISEAAGLSFDRLYMKERLLRVIGKRKKERIIPFGDEAHHWLSKYLSEARPQLEKIRKSIWCFSTRRARHFAQGVFGRGFSGIRAISGVSAKVHNLPTQFRDASARGRRRS